jgi:hypothetical protein
MPTQAARNNSVPSTSCQLKLCIGNAWMTYTLSASELRGLMVEFRKTKGQWQLGTSKPMPLQMPCLKPRPKRSAGLSLATVGLGMLDETEVETIPGARVEPMVQVSTEAAPSLSEILAKPADWHCSDGAGFRGTLRLLRDDGQVGRRFPDHV